MSLPLPDLGAPWWAPYAGVASRPFAQVAGGAPAHEALGAMPSPVELAAGPLRFVPGDSAPEGEAYEAFIARTAGVPTRHNMHDLFNGLAWLRHPHIKRRLNEMQAQHIASHGIGARRGPLRDALTVLDENGALLSAPHEIWQALLARDWRALFVAHRPLWARARLVVFGHALLEKLTIAPRKNLTAHVLVVPREMQEASADFDTSATQVAFTREWLAAKPFTPLPVMGIPGWSPENQNFSFYDDSEVFRPPPQDLKKKEQPARSCIPAQLEAGRPAPI
ncbi:MAG: DUF3025 domain-containing protein [Proteobacteria bacterium]|nr:DUF3025 domain-containing protein [Pseudomonadota bacterium]